MPTVIDDRRRKQLIEEYSRLIEFSKVRHLTDDETNRLYTVDAILFMSDRLKKKQNAQ